jgi:hypothetical protein
VKCGIDTLSDFVVANEMDDDVRVEEKEFAAGAHYSSRVRGGGHTFALRFQEAKNESVTP